jgi:hypothetical protein
MNKIELDAFQHVLTLLREQGCFRVTESDIYRHFGDTGKAHAFLDDLVSMGKLKRLTPEGTWGQYEIYSDGKLHNR